MSDPFLSEIRLFSFGFAPKGWALCAGQLLPINQNQAVFALIGTFYGGDGITNFQLPDLRSRGSRSTWDRTLRSASKPVRNHIRCSPPRCRSTFTWSTPSPTAATGGTNTPSTTVELGSAYTTQTSPVFAGLYSTTAPTISMSPAAVGLTGGGQPHENRMPFLVLPYAIALQGIFPSRN